MINQYLRARTLGAAAAAAALTFGAVNLPLPAGADTIEEATSISEIVAASEFTNADGDVLRLYHAFFDREPDIGGAKYWLDVADQGVTLDEIAGYFALSEEFKITFGQPTNAEFLQVIYANVLDRAPDDDGFEYWLDLLDRSELTRGGVVRWVAANQEFINKYPYTPTAPTTSDYLGSYTLDDAEFGTRVTVTVADGTRTIEANALPNHETGEFPNEGNPNTISEQDRTYTYTTEPTYVGGQSAPMTVGVAVNGVKFEPGTAETVSCTSGETFRVEALQDLYNLGLDFNNAHVQPTGEYHYHGISKLLSDAYATDDDLVHVGFAADGFLIYYSKSGAYSSGYALSTTPRTGTGCTGSSAIGGSAVTVAGTTPDGTYTSDFVWSEANGDLDACNGVEIDGQYSYVITDEFPYISRCLNGESTTGPGPTGPPPGGGAG